MLLSEGPRIGGTLVWYASICIRQVWLMAHCIEPDERNELLILGRLVDRERYPRDKHDVSFGDNRFDIVRNENGTLIVSEVKKSSRSVEAARMQLLHYLYELKKSGTDAKGELLFPEERRRESVSISGEDMERLDALYETIRSVALQDSPPKPERIKYCRNCAYAEYCWS